jgi:hypothetical protein
VLECSLNLTEARISYRGGGWYRGVIGSARKESRRDKQIQRRQTEIRLDIHRNGAKSRSPVVGRAEITPRRSSRVVAYLDTRQIWPEECEPEPNNTVVREMYCTYLMQDIRCTAHTYFMPGRLLWHDDRKGRRGSTRRTNLQCWPGAHP